MRTLTSVFSILALTFALGCSGGDSDDGGGGGADAAPSTVDGGGGGDPDAATSSSADGQACTASEADPTGGCPATHACVGSTCMELCNLTAEMEPDGAACTAYQGPGASACIFGLSANGMAPFAAAACGIFCGDTTGQVPFCQDGSCNGECPNTFTCQDSTTAGVKICQ